MTNFALSISFGPWKMLDGWLKNHLQTAGGLSQAAACLGLIEAVLSVPGLTGCRGQCEGRRMADSPPECQQSGRQRSRERTARTAPPGCCAGSSVRTTNLCLDTFASVSNVENVTALWSGVRYRADASFRVARVRVAVALAELAVAQV